VTNTFLVQGSDPALRDREVQRVVDSLLGDGDRTLSLEDYTIPSRRRSGDEETDEGTSDTASLDVPVFAAVTNALQSPPFMTAFRVVVVREIGALTADQARWLAAWIEDPPETARLVLVAGGGRTTPTLDKACKAHAQMVTPTTEQTAGVLAGALRDADIALADDASAQLIAHLGDDAGRVPELVDILESTYGRGVMLELDAVEAYFGDVGTAGRFDLTNAIDRGDVPRALEVLQRLLTATSSREPRPLHPMQIMASLGWHYQRLLRLDDPAITTKEQAAQVLGLKSAGGARFPLDAAKRLGTDGLREAIRLLARAELDLRGHGGLDERTVIEVLVARLAALSRRHQPAARATKPAGRGRR
jgi:DNA polymerase-3 subunit delta